MQINVFLVCFWFLVTTFYALKNNTSYSIISITMKSMLYIDVQMRNQMGCVLVTCTMCMKIFFLTPSKTMPSAEKTIPIDDSPWCSNVERSLLISSKKKKEKKVMQYRNDILFSGHWIGMSDVLLSCKI